MPGYEIINHKEAKALQDLFVKDNGILFAHGYDAIRKKYHVRTFEKELNKYFKSKYSLVLSSGTAAIKTALKAIGVKQGDQVITQSFNFIATIEAIIDAGAEPIICPVNKNLNIDLKILKRKINRKTKAIIPVHMLGDPTNILEIKSIIRNKDIKIIEDVCEAVGGKFNKKFLGTLGDIGIFSFDFGKTITSGEGGAILTNNKKYFELCKQYHDHGHKNIRNIPRGQDNHGIVGFNYRMTEMQAVVGRVQLKKLKYILRENKKRYQVISKILSKKYRIREISKNGVSINDTFIFFVENFRQKQKILANVNKNNFTTKNLPDAVKWHCSYFWKHALSNTQIKNSKSTYKKLSMAIAIPILLKKSLMDYRKLASSINSL